MGRPLNKKYFGNRNLGSASTTADDGIGGKRVASVTLSALGAYTTRPTVTFSVPDKTALGAVRATGTVTSEVESVTAVGGTQTGYTVGQLVTVDGTDAVLRVATVGGTGGDDALTFDFTGGSRGTFTTLTSGAQTTTSDGAGAGLTVTLRFRAKAVVITEPGSGYTDATDAAPSFTQSVTGTSVMETDGTVISTDGTNENAIVMYANVGNGAGQVDIIKQVSGRRYKVTDGTTTAIVTLGTDSTPETGEAYIVATATGGTYYVTKLTAHRATLVAKTGDEALDGTSAQWTFGSATDTIVSIENA